jgi:hypothetical protein
MPAPGEVQSPSQLTLGATQVRHALREGFLKRKIVFLQEEEAPVRKNQLPVNNLCQGGMGGYEFRGKVEGEGSCAVPYLMLAISIS